MLCNTCTGVVVGAVLCIINVHSHPFARMVCMPRKLESLDVVGATFGLKDMSVV